MRFYYSSPPVGLCITGITAPSGTYVTYSKPIITWTIDKLKKGSNTTLTVTVIAEQSGSKTNTATIKETSLSDSTTTEVKPIADLAIYKDVCSNQATIGSTLTYFITVVNKGPSTATGVIVTDTFSPNATIQSIEPNTLCTSFGSTVTCNLGSMLPQEVITIKVIATPTDAGTVQNIAKVSSDVSDPDNTNNTALKNVEIIKAADLGVAKSAVPVVTVLGEKVQYTITITNYGPSVATNVNITDTLPAGIEVDPASLPPACSLVGDTIRCTFPQLEANQAEIITFSATATQAGVLVNLVTVKATEMDPNSCNNNATATIFVGSVAGTDLMIQKTHSPEPVLVCTPLTYTIKVTNNGPEVATGVIVVDQLPPTVDILSIQTSQGQCCYPWKGCCPPARDCCASASECTPNLHCQSVREIVCELGSLAVGASAEVQIVVKPKVVGPLVNTALVSANQNDTIPSNNQVKNTAEVITLVEQIDNMIQMINDLMTAGQMKREEAEFLIADLMRGQWGFQCGNTGEIQNALNYFTQRIKYLISQEALPMDAACWLAKVAELLKEQVHCPCVCPGASDH